VLAGQKKKANENAFLLGVRPLAKKDLVHGRNRNRCIAVHLNDEELEKLKRMKGKIPYSAYIRNVLFGRTPKIIPKPNREAYSETARWASALNQIARRLNMGEDVEMQEVRELLKRFRQSLMGIEFEQVDIDDLED